MKQLWTSFVLGFGIKWQKEKPIIIMVIAWCLVCVIWLVVNHDIPADPVICLHECCVSQSASGYEMVVADSVRIEAIARWVVLSQVSTADFSRACELIISTAR